MWLAHLCGCISSTTKIYDAQTIKKFYSCSWNSLHQGNCGRVYKEGEYFLWVPKRYQNYSWKNIRLLRISESPGFRYWSFFRTPYLNSLKLHTVRVNSHGKSFSGHPQRSTERQWLRGSPNNMLFWFLAGPSQEPLVHPRPFLQPQRNTEAQMWVRTQIKGKDTSSRPIPGLFQGSLMTSAEVWHPTQWISSVVPFGLSVGFPLGMQDVLEDAFQDYIQKIWWHV